MTPIAIVFLLLSTLLLWGGLAVTLLRLRRFPELGADEADTIHISPDEVVPPST